MPAPCSRGRCPSSILAPLSPASPAVPIPPTPTILNGLPLRRVDHGSETIQILGRRWLRVQKRHHHPIERPIEDPIHESPGQFADGSLRRLPGKVDERSTFHDMTGQALLLFHDVQQGLNRAVGHRPCVPFRSSWTSRTLALPRAHKIFMISSSRSVTIWVLRTTSSGNDEKNENNHARKLPAPRGYASLSKSESTCLPARLSSFARTTRLPRRPVLAGLSSFSNCPDSPSSSQTGRHSFKTNLR